MMKITAMATTALLVMAACGGGDAGPKPTAGPSLAELKRSGAQQYADYLQANAGKTYPVDALPGAVTCWHGEVNLQASGGDPIATDMFLRRAIDLTDGAGKIVEDVVQLVPTSPASMRYVATTTIPAGAMTEVNAHYTGFGAYAAGTAGDPDGHDEFILLYKFKNDGVFAGTRTAVVDGKLHLLSLVFSDKANASAGGIDPAQGTAATAAFKKLITKGNIQESPVKIAVGALGELDAIPAAECDAVFAAFPPAKVNF